MKKWVVPALAGGAGLVALYALLHRKDKGASPPPVDNPDVNPDTATPPEGSTKPSPGTLGSEKPPQLPSDLNKFLETNGVRVDSSFTDADRRGVAQAVNLFPECQRRWLVGMVVRNDPNLQWRDGRGCLPGKNTSMNPPTVTLNTRCRTGMGNHVALLVHEMMHVLANRRGYYNTYRQVFNQHPNCGVSMYSHEFYRGRNINEDFAEAARWAVYPQSSGFYSGSCVTPKLQEARRIIQRCQ